MALATVTTLKSVSYGVQRFDFALNGSTVIYADVVFRKGLPKDVDWVCNRLRSESEQHVPPHCDSGIEFCSHAYDDHRLILKAEYNSFMFNDIGNFNQFVDSVLHARRIFAGWKEATFYYFAPSYLGEPEIWTAYSANDQYKFVTVKSHTDLPFHSAQSELERAMIMQWLKDHLLFK